MYDENISYSEHLWNSFVIDGCKLKNLTKLLQDRIGNVTFSGEFVHGVSRQFETVGDLIDYENPRSKQIRQISLHASSDDRSQSVIIVFFCAWGFPAIAITLDVCEKVVFILLDEIKDVIRGMRPWYDVLSRCLILYSLGISWLFTLIGIFWFKGYIQGVIGTFDADSRELIIRLILTLSTPVMWFAIYKLLVFVFPPTVFAIGQGKARFNRMKWRHAVLVSVILGLIFFVMKLVIN